jgi:nitroimidazol reductase NimA-like FMN-containing flavoprotein (pyridoxamine 5'-phosphate oxidase superfamily)
MSQAECCELLKRAQLGRLAVSRQDQPYVVPIAFSFDPERNCLYLFSTLGKKIEWMRENPKVSFQADEIAYRSNWSSVVLNGTYLELRDPQHATEKQHARQCLSQHRQWWLLPMEERRGEVPDLDIDPIFFRVDIASMTGLRAVND